MNFPSSRTSKKDTSVNADLQSWSEISAHFKNGAILLGNGSSCAIWEKFGYSSLFEQAKSKEKIANPLSLEDIKVFDSLDTKNFELILSSLSQTAEISKIFRKDSTVFDEHYEHIKTALGEAVRSVHIPWHEITNSDVLPKIRQELRNYKWIFSTNYDLLVYWAIMSENNGAGFKDYFWGFGGSGARDSFDKFDTDVKDIHTRVLYLHGALHLKRDPVTAQTSKIANSDGGTILEVLEVPLFITEGSSKDKMRAIRESDYLGFAYDQLMLQKESLVIFGHSLDAKDDHLIKAIGRNMPKKIAVSIRSSNNEDYILERKVIIRNKFLTGKFRPEIFFFDAATHPLGSKDIKIQDCGMDAEADIPWSQLPSEIAF
jgi:Domain of unknown function (DUF4917)